jgi:hypothetical protein
LLGIINVDDTAHEITGIVHDIVNGVPVFIVKRIQEVVQKLSDLAFLPPIFPLIVMNRVFVILKDFS